MFNFIPLVQSFLHFQVITRYDRITTENLLQKQSIPFEHNSPLYRLHRICDENKIECYHKVDKTIALSHDVVYAISVLLNKILKFLPNDAQYPIPVEDHLIKDIHTNYIYDILIAGREELLTPSATLFNTITSSDYPNYGPLSLRYVNAVFSKITKDIIDLLRERNDLESLTSNSLIEILEKDKEFYFIFNF